MTPSFFAQAWRGLRFFASRLARASAADTGRRYVFGSLNREPIRRAVGYIAAMLRLPLVLVGIASVSLAGEGKWTPQQVLELGPAWVKQQGFSLPLSKLWDEKKAGGLLANAVQLPGCSGSFVSADGLLITNHHCIVGILQEHSTPAANLVKNGYLAKTRDDEKPAKAFRIQVPRRFVDVTKDVLAAVPEGADDLTRFKAVEAKQKQLVAECEAKAGTRCTFAAFDEEMLKNIKINLKHFLHRFLPSQSYASQNYNLRPRSHNLELPDRISHLTDCNFIRRMLYSKIY